MRLRGQPHTGNPLRPGQRPGAPLAELIAEPTAGREARVLRYGQGHHASGTAVEAWLLHRQHGNRNHHRDLTLEADSPT
ncbi:MAG TPA: hypothetical protein VN327_15730 [Pseudonocardiaceae bacterium]|nr:hypothetical protein [Pseudonocardiaceae bacterium]